MVSPLLLVAVRLWFLGMTRPERVAVLEIACEVSAILNGPLSVATSSPVGSWTWSVHDDPDMSVDLNDLSHDEGDDGAILGPFDLACHFDCDFPSPHLLVCGHSYVRLSPS